MTDRLRHVNPDALHPPTGYTHVVEVQRGVSRTSRGKLLSTNPANWSARATSLRKRDRSSRI